jgi:diguanylate cyclase (GGDEF)-like protein/PAS domain S-box-containing protein
VGSADPRGERALAPSGPGPDGPTGEQFRDLLEAAPDAMVIVDADGHITLVNRQTERLFGYSRDELVGQPVEILLPETIRHRHTAQRQAYTTAPEVRPMGAGLELSARRRDGTEFPAEISLSPLQTAQGLLISAAVRDITERKRAAAALAHQAMHDPLTGLPNRALLGDRLTRALTRAGRHHGIVAVLFLDLDGFKLVNDSRGHAAGDRLLVAVAERLQDLVRSTDTVARFAGDEFVVVAEDGMDAHEARALAERVSHGFTRPLTVDGEDLYVTTSIGIALGSGDASVEGLLSDADGAMYRAKDSGRSRVEMFDSAMRGEAEARLQIQNDLHRALVRNELRVHYQPVVDLRTGAITGAEALVRWAHPEQGLLSPGQFVPVAEDSGLIVPVGAEVLRQAAAQWTAWDLPPRRILNVNLSAHQVRHPDVVQMVDTTLRHTGLPAEALCLELTESVLIDDLHSRRRVLDELKALGVRLAIDDFGTGYSSLTYLKRFPIDIVKIDRSFLAGLGQRQYDLTILAAMIELVHALGLRATAEGIETPEQLAQLRLLGCDLGQGYHFAAPVPASEYPTVAGRDHSFAPGPHAVATPA